MKFASATLLPLVSVFFAAPIEVIGLSPDTPDELEYTQLEFSTPSKFPDMTNEWGKSEMRFNGE
jgi:hypothetical protein